MKEQAGAESAIVHHLWESYCGTLRDASSTSSSGSSTLLDYTDPVVDEIWQLFFPILNQIKLIPVGSPTMSAPPIASNKPNPFEPATNHDNDAKDIAMPGVLQGSEDPDSNCGFDLATHVFYLALGGSSADDGGPPAPTLSREMASLLCQQPHIVLPLLEFFVALMEYRRGNNRANGNNTVTGSHHSNPLRSTETKKKWRHHTAAGSTHEKGKKKEAARRIPIGCG
ncbi:unnamed protein product [Phytomonas sp. Hart1]|nr:unnamed protein product [Phytomonas sp. Hart1]|eukprot:CCW69041.1 unnamed protein product [Phytomonas sp. isolate Hart1]